MIIWTKNTYKKKNSSIFKLNFALGSSSYTQDHYKKHSIPSDSLFPTSKWLRDHLPYTHINIHIIWDFSPLCVWKIFVRNGVVHCNWEKKKDENLLAPLFPYRYTEVMFWLSKKETKENSIAERHLNHRSRLSFTPIFWLLISHISSRTGRYAAKMNAEHLEPVNVITKNVP